MRTPVVNPRRAQLGRLAMYAIVFAAGALTQTIVHDPLTGGLAFLGLFAPIDLLFEFLYGLLADYRERHEAAPSNGPGRSRREARRATRQVKTPAPADGSSSTANGGPGAVRRAPRR